MILELPYPPSVNTYWRHARGRHYISAKGKAYREAVQWAAKQGDLVADAPMEGRLKVCVSLWMPDKRRRDLDNTMKALLDALEHADVYEDDSQIDELQIIRKEVEPPGKALVEIMPVDDRSRAFQLGVYS